MHFHSRKCSWNCHLRNGGHFVSASMCSTFPFREKPTMFVFALQIYFNKWFSLLIVEFPSVEERLGFQMHFLYSRLLYFDSNFTEACLCQGPVDRISISIMLMTWSQATSHYLFETIPETCIVEFLREAGFFYLIWCNLLTSTSPQTFTIWSDLE